MALLAQSAWSEEPAAEFLEKLREAGYYDTAVDYLELVQESPLVSTGFKEVLPYERAVTILRQAHSIRDFAVREKLLDAAYTSLRQFQAERSDHPLLMDARRESANVVVERARIKIERSKKPSEAANKALLLGDALKLFEEAQKLFAEQQAELKVRLESIPKVLDRNRDAKLVELQTQLRSTYLQAMFLSAAVREEAAQAVEPGSEQYKKFLNEAKQQYEAMFKNYRTRIAGLKARLGQGRCEQRLGNFKEALSYYVELMDNSADNETMFELKVEATLGACQCWMDPSLAKYAEVVERTRAVVEKAPPHNSRDEMVLKLRLLLVEAAKKYVDELKTQNAKDPKINLLLADARKYAQFVAKINGELQKPAQKLLGELGGGGSVAAVSRKKYTTFDEAKSAAMEAYDETKAPKLTMDALTEQIKETPDAAERKEMEKQIAEAKTAYEDGLNETVRVVKDALGLAEKETAPDDLNNLRNLYCFLLYNQGQYYSAATIGEFVARRYPDASAARTCAKIAMASYLKLYQETKAESKPVIDRFMELLDKDNDGRISHEELAAASDEIKAQWADADVNQDKKIDSGEIVRALTRFESDHIVDICNYIALKWPDQPEAQESLGTLISFMITEGQLAKAETYLDKIPADSPQRGSAELRIGQAQWSAYVRGMQAIREQEDAAIKAGQDRAALENQHRAQREELKVVKDRAEKTLEDGVKRMEQTGKIDTTLASALLALAQVWIDTNQAPRAVGLIEHPTYGLLKLVADEHEAVQKRGFREDTFKVALRSYISSLAAKDSDAKALIQKANDIMARLKQSIGGSAEGQKTLVAVYISLARELEQQIRLSTDESRPGLIQGFKTFLDQVGAGSNELNVLYWVASTYASMADSNPQAKDAVEHHKRAAETYQLILDKGKRNELSLDAAMRNQISIQLARSKRATGDFEGAINLLKDQLTANQGLVPVQMEAARTYQDWAEKDPKKYVTAGDGSFPDPKTRGKIIWGWGGLANKVAGKQGFHNQFYEARYNYSVCQYRYALTQTDAAERTKLLSKARQSLRQTVDLYPNLQGDGTPNQRDFTRDYDSLLKAIQKQLKEPESGLAGLKKETPTGKQAAPNAGAPAAGGPAPGGIPKSGALPGTAKGLPAAGGSP
jgi:hypothetical protein